MEHFRRATCYKVVGNDPCDKMILDLASLKSGLSKSVVNKYIDGNHIIPNFELLEIYNSFKYLHNLSEEHKQNKKKEMEKCRDELPEVEEASSYIFHNELLDEHSDNSTEQKSVIIPQTYKKDAFSPQYSNMGKEELTAESSIAGSMACKILNILSKIDGGGTLLKQIFSFSKQKLQIEMLNLFLVNLDIWGSNPPTKLESSGSSVPSLADHRSKAYAKIKMIKRNLEQIKDEYNNCLKPKIRKVLDSLSTLISFMERVEQYLQHRQVSEKSSSESGAGHPCDSVGGSDEICSKTSGFELLAEQPGLVDESVIGHLLTLNCGHNGNLRYAELNIYDKHLICLLYTSPSPRDLSTSRMPSSA
eukprot:TRINITY_DN2114_c0_g1_i2.p1 TRINITY_DN2114_c0_g1~~TRINITY_DN2114_c0_g1_i2.p1  ORF type:complete len:361 (+),score=55.28 TRINITY_DN2114_c0_g1_i2:441-1523(+)